MGDSDLASSCAASDASTTVWLKCKTCLDVFPSSPSNRYYKHCRHCFEDYKRKKGFSTAPSDPIKRPTPKHLAKAVLIQSSVRMWIARRRFRKCRSFALRLLRLRLPAKQVDASTQTDTDTSKTSTREFGTCTRHDGMTDPFLSRPPPPLPAPSTLTLEQRVSNSEHDIAWLRNHMFEAMNEMHLRLQSLERSWPQLGRPPRTQPAKAPPPLRGAWTS